MIVYFLVKSYLVKQKNLYGKISLSVINRRRYQLMDQFMNQGALYLNSVFKA